MFKVCLRIPMTLFFTMLVSAFFLQAGDQCQWGQKWTRNMVSSEKNLPVHFDPATGRNIKWVARLGTETYASPIVAGGRIFLGTNNSFPRDPRHKGKRGILFCLNEKDGSLIWQAVIPKIPGEPLKDWPGTGFVAPPTVEGDRAYALSNRGELLCLDVHGQANGNDGPYKDEGRLMVPKGEKPVAVTAMDADVVWRFPIHDRVGSYPHDAAHSGIMIDGPFLYINTSNGVDNTHRFVRKPEAPSLIVVDKNTGRWIGRDNEPIGGMIFHCTWATPSMAEVNGRKLVFFGGGDGVVYAFEAMTEMPPAGKVAGLKRVWRFDCDPEAPKEDIQSYTGNRQESPSNIKGSTVFWDNKVYVAAGGDIWWGKRKSWLKCIDATQTGDITKTGCIWSYPMDGHCCSTPAIHDGLVYITDCARYIHCLDAKTGKLYWKHNAKGDMWASPLVADGKVYVGTRRRTLWIFEAGRELNVLNSVQLDSAIIGTVTAANGVLYVASMRQLYAIQK